MSKIIEFGPKGRKQLVKGIDTLADAVVSTLGPNGRNVVIEKEHQQVQSTKDGVTVAKHISLKDPIENLGVSLVKDASIKTADKAGLIIPVKITIYDDRSYSFILKSPPASVLLAKFANVKKGASEPNRETVGKVTLDQVKEIATIKMNDLNTDNIDQAVLIIKGTAKNMGIEVEN